MWLAYTMALFVFFLQIICTLIKLIFVFFASVEISCGCWNEVSSMACKKMEQLNFFYFFFIQFNVPFNIISLIETSQSICGAKREYPGKTT